MPTRTLDQMPAGSLRVYRAGDGSLHATGTSLAEGIMDYGNGRLQLITPEAVLSAGELDARAVITLGHPNEPVTPDNVQRYQVGDAGSTARIQKTKGGFSECVIDFAIRTAPAIKLADEGKIKGLSRSHLPIIEQRSGVHPTFGAYTEVRTGHIGDTEHIALCGDSAELPPPRGPGCGVYLDSLPRSVPMDPKVLAAKVKAAFDAVAKCTDAVSYDKAVAMLKELAADPDGLLLIKAYAEKGGKEEKPKEEPAAVDPGAPPSMDAIRAAAKAEADALLKPVLDRLAALDAQATAATEARKTADAQAQAKRDADAQTLARTHAERHGLLTAPTSDAATCLAHLRSKLGLAADAAPDAVLAVATYAASQIVAPIRIGDSNLFGAPVIAARDLA